MARPQPISHGGAIPRTPSSQLVGTGLYAALRSARVAAALRPDTPTMLIMLTLLVIGLVMVQSASQYTHPFDPGAFARRDLLWSSLGGLVLALTTHLDYRRLRRLAWPAAVAAAILLAVVVRFGVSVGGAQRWLAIGHSVTFQPSEIAKLGFVIFAAAWLGDGPDRFGKHRLAIYAGVTAVFVGLVLLQNDLGTALVLAGLSLALVLVAGAPLRRVLPWAVLGGVLGAMVIAGTPFRRARILAFLHPLNCGSDGASHHVCQSLLALGSGGITGQGLGQGIEQAGYLPAPFTDSIFAVIGEELGFIGEIAVIALFGALLWRGLRIANQAPDRFGALLASGVTVWIIIQACLNIGSSVAALPFTGVPLPFISFGGSSLVVLMGAIGIMLNISAQGNGHAARQRSQPQNSAYPQKPPR